MNWKVKMIFAFTLILFTVAFSLPTPGYREERRFLAESGFGDLAGRFEEVEIQHILRISDDTLRYLGVHTIGPQIRLRYCSSRSNIH